MDSLFLKSLRRPIRRSLASGHGGGRCSCYHGVDRGCDFLQCHHQRMWERTSLVNCHAAWNQNRQLLRSLSSHLSLPWNTTNHSLTHHDSDRPLAMVNHKALTTNCHYLNIKHHSLTNIMNHRCLHRPLLAINHSFIMLVNLLAALSTSDGFIHWV